MTLTGFLCMAGIYYLVESAVYGSFLVPLVEIPANLVQFAFGLAAAAAAAGVLLKTPAGDSFPKV